MQAIVTKYIGPASIKGSRVKATASAGSVTLHWDDALNAEANHCAAAKALASKLGWSYGTWVSGGLPNSNNSVWVCSDLDPREGYEQFTLAQHSRTTKDDMTYDTVYRYGDNTFTGVPFANLHHGIWYWPDCKTARDFAEAHKLPTDRITCHERGWAIQMRKSGPYVDAPK